MYKIAKPKPAHLTMNRFRFRFKLTAVLNSFIVAKNSLILFEIHLLKLPGVLYALFDCGLTFYFSQLVVFIGMILIIVLHLFY